MKMYLDKLIHTEHVLPLKLESGFQSLNNFILLFIDVCKGFVGLYNYESFLRGPGSWPSIDYAFA